MSGNNYSHTFPDDGRGRAYDDAFHTPSYRDSSSGTDSAERASMYEPYADKNADRRKGSISKDDGIQYAYQANHDPQEEPLVTNAAKPSNGKVQFEDLGSCRLLLA